LNEDEETEIIVIVSKPPKPEIVTRLLAHALGIKKPVVVDFIGYPPAARRIANIHFATGLENAASIAVDLANSDNKEDIFGSGSVESSDAKGYLRGIFSGGTLAYEALLGLQSFVSPIYSNAPIYEYQRLSDVWQSHEHTLVDMGEDEFTQGRLHPMMDNDLRLRRLAQEAADPEVSVIMMDVVLGTGAHDNPAAELGPAIKAAIESSRNQGRYLEILIIMVGTEEDSQALLEQEEIFEAAGALVFRSTLGAVDYAVQRLAHASPNPSLSIELEEFKKPLSVINVGLEIFYDSMKSQDAGVVQVDWRPPAGGNEKLMALLAKMK
jgi:FdrA protein